MASIRHWATHLFQKEPQTLQERVVYVYHRFYDSIKHFYDAKVYHNFIEPVVRSLSPSISDSLVTAGFFTLIVFAMLCAFVFLPMTAIMQYVPGFGEQSSKKNAKIVDTTNNNTTNNNSLHESSTNFPYSQNKAYYDEYTPHHPLTNRNEDGTALFQTHFPFEDLPEQEAADLYSPLPKPPTPSQMRARLAQPRSYTNGQFNQQQYRVPTSLTRQPYNPSTSAAAPAAPAANNTAFVENCSPFDEIVHSESDSDFENAFTKRFKAQPTTTTAHNPPPQTFPRIVEDSDSDYIPESDHNLRNRAWLERRGQFGETEAPSSRIASESDVDLFNPKFSTSSSSLAPHIQPENATPLERIPSEHHNEPHNEPHDDFEPTIGDDDYDAFASTNIDKVHSPDHVSFSSTVDVMTTGEKLPDDVINNDLAQGNTIHPNKVLNNHDNQLRSRYKHTPAAENSEADPGPLEVQGQKRTYSQRHEIRPADVAQQREEVKVDDFEHEQAIMANPAHLAKQPDLSTDPATSITSPFSPPFASDHQVYRSVGQGVLKNLPAHNQYSDLATSIMSPLTRARRELGNDNTNLPLANGVRSSIFPLFNRMENRNKQGFD